MAGARTPGYETWTASTGEDALREARRARPAAVVLGKLGVHSRTQAVAAAYRDGLINGN